MSEQELDFIDLGALDRNVELQEKGIDVEIVGPDNKPTGLVIFVYGPDSTHAEKALLQLQSETEKEAAASFDFDPNTPEQSKHRQLRYLSLITKGWNKPPVVAGERLEFSVDNAYRLYQTYKLIDAQVRFKADRRSSFTES